MLAMLSVGAIAAAPQAWAIDDYEACLALIAKDPIKAEQAAGEWARFGGGGAPARHCHALAMLETGAPLRAADALISLVQEDPTLTDRARADLLVQAGEILVTEGQTVTAVVLADKALRLIPNDPASLGLRAAAALADGDPARALGDLNMALGTSDTSVPLLVRRARAHRGVGNAVAARDDANLATNLASDSAPAWAERGRAEATLGFTEDARRSFLRAVALDRDGTVGRAAQLDLQRMDAGIAE